MGGGGVEKVQALGRRVSDTLCSYTFPAILLTAEVLSPQEAKCPASSHLSP